MVLIIDWSAVSESRHDPWKGFYSGLYTSRASISTVVEPIDAREPSDLKQQPREDPEVPSASLAFECIQLQKRKIVSMSLHT